MKSLVCLHRSTIVKGALADDTANWMERPFFSDNPQHRHHGLLPVSVWRFPQ